MKKVIITGATGFIGGALTRKLLNDGIKVYAIGTNKEKLNDLSNYKNCVTISAKLEEYDNIYQYIDVDDEIDAIFHFAWSGLCGADLKNYSQQLNNTLYSCQLMDLAVKINCKKFVFAGSINEIESLDYITNPKDKLRYTNNYSASKIATEIICKTIASNNNIKYNCGIIAMSYGENNYSKMLPNIVINQLNNNQEPQLISGENLYDLIYIDDIVNGFIAIAESGHNLKSYYLGHRKLKTFKELIFDIRNFINPNVNLNFGVYPDESYIDYSKINLNELYNDTGFECKADFKESILKTADWLKEQNI